MKKYISYLYALALSQTARSTYLTTFGAGLSAFLGFVFNIVVARSITPADFGIFSVVLNLITVLLVIADVGLSAAVIKFLPQALREGKREEVSKIIKLSFLITFLIGAVLAILLLAFAGPLSVIVFNQARLSLPLIFASFSLIGLSLSYLFVSILQGQQKFLFGVITESSTLLVKVLVTFLLLYLGKLNLVSATLVFSLTTFVGLVIGFFLISPTFLTAKINFALVKVLLGFGIWVALARITNALASRIDTLMLVRFVEAEKVGFYAAAQKMTFVFPVLVTGATVVLSPKFSSLKTIPEVKTFSQKAVLLISLLFLPIIILYALAPGLTIWIFGQIYEPAAIIFRWLLISSFFFIANTLPMLIILYFLGDSRFFAFISFLQLALIFVANLFLIPKFGVVGPALSLAFAYSTIFVISSLFVLKRLSRK